MHPQHRHDGFDVQLALKIWVHELEEFPNPDEEDGTAGDSGNSTSSGGDGMGSSSIAGPVATEAAKLLVRSVVG